VFFYNARFIIVLIEAHIIGALVFFGENRQGEAMQVAIIGAGPRGLAVAERLINNADAQTPLEIHIFDPSALGGRVWDAFVPYNREFLMNTVTEQVTLFSDDSIENGGKPVIGPNLYQWLNNEAAEFLAHHPEFDAQYRYITADLTADDFAPRGVMGLYATWFFEWLQARLNGRQTLTYVQQAVTDIDKNDTGVYVVTLADGQTVEVEHVVMGLGHSDNQLNDEERTLSEFAKTQQLPYIQPLPPSEAPLEQIGAQEPVLIRGLGLSFFDYLYALTGGRGGHFVRDEAGVLQYEASGNEPVIIAGSRGGFPLHARGVNQKNVSELYVPTFLTMNALEAARVADGGHLTYATFEKLLLKELTYKHILNVLDQTGDQLDYVSRETLQEDLLTSDDLVETAVAAGLAREAVEFDLDKLMHPAKGVSEKDDYQAFMLAYLQADIEDAKLGNKFAPYAGAFDILRDVRDRIRTLVEKAFFSVDEYAVFLEKFTPINSLLSVGPPVERIEQLHALIRAGVVTITAPNVKVKPDEEAKAFVVTADFDQTYQVTGVVEARLGTPDIQRSKNPLIVALREKGWITTPVLTKQTGEKWPLRASHINRQTFELVDQSGEERANLYMYGVPTEGWKWFTTVIPRPGVNTVILREAAWIAQRILAHDV
jgi:uncharacterized NAD(P)/FAD-binding protein YdhS